MWIVARVAKFYSVIGTSQVCGKVDLTPLNRRSIQNSMGELCVDRNTHLLNAPIRRDKPLCLFVHRVQRPLPNLVGSEVNENGAGQ